MSQSQMNFKDPDNCQKQRRLVQFWLKTIGKDKETHELRRPKFLVWARRKMKIELTPVNYNYVYGQWEKDLDKWIRQYERHIAAERSVKNGLGNSGSNNSLMPDSTRLMDD